MEETFELFLEARKGLSMAHDVDSCSPYKEISRAKSLLVTDWRRSLFDGVLSIETLGFFDEDGMPPWDTWLALLKVEESLGKHCLLSWVPSEVSDLVDMAIPIDAAMCLSWLCFGQADKLWLNGWGKHWEE
jgi:hypothetical protein